MSLYLVFLVVLYYIAQCAYRFSDVNLVAEFCWEQTLMVRIWKVIPMLGSSNPYNNVVSVFL